MNKEKLIKLFDLRRLNNENQLAVVKALQEDENNQEVYISMLKELENQFDKIRNLIKQNI